MVRMRRVWRMLIRWWLEISSVWWRWRVRRGWVAGCSWVELCLVLWWWWEVRRWVSSRSRAIGRVIRIPGGMLVGGPCGWRLHVWREVGVVQVWVLIGWVHWVCWVWTCVVGSWVWLRFLRKHRQVKVFARIILVFIIINGLFFGLIVTIILLFLFNSCNKRGGGAVISGSERSIQSFISTFRKFLSCILRWFLSWRRGTLGWCWTCFWIIVTSKTFLKESTGQVHKVLV